MGIQILNDELDTIRNDMLYYNLSNDISECVSDTSVSTEDMPQILSLRFGARTMSLNQNNSYLYDAYFCDEYDQDSDTFCEEILEKLETENAELIEQLNKFQNDGCVSEQAAFSWDDQEPNVMDIFDDNDLNEMEELFKKCDDAINDNKLRKVNAKKKRWYKHSLLYNQYK